MFHKNSMFPMTYRLHILRGSFISRNSHSRLCSCHHSGARSIVPAKKSNTAPIVPQWQWMSSSFQWLYAHFSCFGAVIPIHSKSGYAWLMALTMARFSSSLNAGL